MAGRARKGRRAIGASVLDASMRRLLMAQTNGKDSLAEQVEKERKFL